MKLFRNKSISGFLIVCCLFFAAAVSVNSDALNSLALYAAIPLAFLLSYFHVGKIAPNKYMSILMAIYIWDCISLIWAAYPESSSRELHRILGAFLLSYIMAANGNSIKMCKYLYVTFFVLYIGAWYYSYNNSLVVMDMTSDADRLNDDKLNANTMAYYTFYVTMGAFLLSYLIKSVKWNMFFKLLFLAMLPISFFVAIFTASRQVLIIQIPLMGFLIYERYLKEAKLSTKMIFLLCAIIAIISVLPKAIEIYDNSYLAVRAQKRLEEDSRWFLMWDAIQVGINHFPFGVGAGNYINYSFNKHFSHCSYAELFANNGIVGLSLYCYLVLYFIKVQWKRYRKTLDRKFVVFLVFGIIYAIDQLFYVFYIDLWLIAFFILVATHSDTYYNSLNMSNYNSQKYTIQVKH